MRDTLALLSTAILLCAGCAAETGDSAPQSAAADTAWVNGKIYTVDESRPWAEAIAVKDGRILAVGSNADVEAVTGADTRVVDLGQQFVMPGIVDTHAHAMEGGVEQFDCSTAFVGRQPDLGGDGREHS